MDKLTSYRLLSFDVYGTLVDWETGILTALEPLLPTSPEETKYTRSQLLQVHSELEANQQIKTPEMTYSQLLTTIHPQIAERLGLGQPAEEASIKFGQSIGQWPAFPDTVDALRRLSKYYKLVVLSNVDRESFGATNAGPLAGFSFDAILTAQDVGSYKPDLQNFKYMIGEVKDRFGVEKDQILQTAQSQFHDHHPARKMAIKSVWIVRPGGTMGNRAEELYDWKFDTLGQMADAVEKENGVVS